jgi:glycosyltransferase involved in cell wall biosynthesis
MKKNICIVVNSLGEGGAERVVLSLAQALSKLECRVDVIALEEVRNPYPIEHFDFNVHVMKRIKRPLGYLYSLKAMHLKNKINEIGVDFDLILSNLLMSDIVVKKMNMPNTYHCIHNTISKSIAPQENQKISFSRIKRKILYNFLSKKVYKNQDLITVSEGVKKDLLEFGIRPKSVQVIYNTFDFMNIRRQSDSYAINQPEYIIHVGRFDRQKRHDILIKAYKESRITEKLILIGENNTESGRLAKKLVQELGLEDRIIFLGFIANPYPYIKNAKALVLSSDFEGLPTVLIEAMILDVPVVSTDCKSGPSEILIDELKPYLSPIGNINLLADNITKMIGHPVEITENYIDRFSSEKSARKYLSLCGK